MRWIHAAQPRTRGSVAHLYRRRRRNGVLLFRCAAVAFIFIALLIISSVLFTKKVQNGKEVSKISGHANGTHMNRTVGKDAATASESEGLAVPSQAPLGKSPRFERVVTPYMREREGTGSTNQNSGGGGGYDFSVPRASYASSPLVSVDIHLFVVWKTALHARKRILEDMAQSFIILDMARFDWVSPPVPSGTESAIVEAGKKVEHKDAFLVNLWRLYSGKGGWDRKDAMDIKVRQCGRGKFIAVIVADVNPVYETKHTAHGDDYVNQKMHMKKAQYRKWGGAEFSVHGTYDPIEADHDIRMLMHASTNAYQREMMGMGALRKQPELKRRGSELVRRYLQNPERFTVQSDTYGFERPKNEAVGTIEWPTCKALLFALETVPDVVVVEGGGSTDRTGPAGDGWREPLWISRSAKSERSGGAGGEGDEKNAATGVAASSVATVVAPCATWPSELIMYVPDKPTLYSVASLMMGDREAADAAPTFSETFRVSVGEDAAPVRVTVQVVSDAGFRTWLAEHRISQLKR